jgi:hypothetical protein
MTSPWVVSHDRLVAVATGVHFYMTTFPLYLFAETVSVNVSSQILLGVVSGLVTSMAVFVFTVIWKQHLVPWYEQRVYNGVSIEGMWTLVDTNQPETSPEEWTQLETLSISQAAQRLSGTLTLAPKAGVDSPIFTLKMTGDISDRFVTLLMKSPSRSRIAYSVMLGQVVGEGNRIQAQTAYYDVSHNEVLAARVVYQRRA